MNITHIFCYPGTGGAEKYALYLAAESKKSGHCVSFIFGETGSMIEASRTSGYSSQIIKMPSWFSFRAILSLKKYFEQNNVQIVHAHFLREHFLAVGAKMLGANIRVIRTFHRLDQLPFRVRPFYALVQRKTDAFIAVSDYVKNEMIKKGIKESKIRVIKNGVPPVSINKRGAAIGYLGRLSSEKGILKFVRTNADYFKSSGAHEIIIAGDGPDADTIKSMNIDKIKLIGQIKDLSKFFEKISVLVLPSETEALPLVVPEAFSAGIPVVAFELEPLKEIIPENYMVKTGDYMALREMATRLIETDDSENLKKIYKDNFTINKMWVATEALYKSLLD